MSAMTNEEKLMKVIELNSEDEVLDIIDAGEVNVNFIDQVCIELIIFMYFIV